MTEALDAFTKLSRRLFLAKLVLVLSFCAAAGTTLLALSLSFAPAGYPRLIPGPPEAQTTILTTTATATTLFSQTTASSTQEGPGAALSPLRIAPTVQQYSGLAALVSWTVFFGALIWRGHVRSVWGRSRFSYDTFRLLVRMRGAQTRLKLMHSLDEPKNKLQLATALGIDWKTVDKHVQVLEKNGLIAATSTSGTAVFYELTEKGKQLLELLEELGADTTQ